MYKQYVNKIRLCVVLFGVHWPSMPGVPSQLDATALHVSLNLCVCPFPTPLNVNENTLSFGQHLRKWEYASIISLKWIMTSMTGPHV